MDASNYSLSDIAMAAKGLGGSGEGGWAWLFLIIVILAVGRGGFGSNAGPAPMPVNVATQTDVQNAINNQAVNNGIQQVLLSSANNNYETAQLINGQTSAFMQQNNANQINMIQGFNNIVQQLTGQTYQLSNKLDGLSHHMDQCCCDVKQTLMQQQLDEANRRLLEEQNKNNINQQSQYLLGNMGRFVAWEGSGAAASSAIAS